MVIPKSFKLGKMQYRTVQWRRKLLPTKVYGSVYPDIGCLQIAMRRPPKAVAETFWHEVTHAILHDMNNPLWKDEKFVTAFSKRLAQVVRTAEVEGV